MPALTPSQTIGPFLRIQVPYEGEERMVAENDPDAIHIRGTVYDGEGEIVDDALVEIWQANRVGRYAHPEDNREELPLEEGFTGFGRCATDSEGRFEFITVKPGRVPARGGGLQAPHIDVSVFARGLLKRLVTRIYFPDEAEANAEDPVLSSIEHPKERDTLVAIPQEGGLRFDIHLQGDGETAFFVV
ncbi:MAG: protocatechuate 3,4-dioxygenase subunit alpha [Solirubrobacterales bacterium]|nr:protocatechuate 3,4-dioxygenase subunit alpha [Solirubrobacterales bacterium]